MKEMWLTRIAKIDVISNFEKLGFNLKNVEIEENFHFGVHLLKIELLGEDGYLYSKFFNDYGEVKVTKDKIVLKTISKNASENLLLKTWFETINTANLGRKIENLEYKDAFYQAHIEEINRERDEAIEKLKVLYGLSTAENDENENELKNLENKIKVVRKNCNKQKTLLNDFMADLGVTLDGMKGK